MLLRFLAVFLLALIFLAPPIPAREATPLERARALKDEGEYEKADAVLRAAIEIYQIKAATGKLPQKLPAGMPKDMFSGKDFEYSVTRGGFVLKCRAKNLKADKIEEYEFGIAE